MENVLLSVLFYQANNAVFGQSSPAKAEAEEISS
jgi:hypothetical protein